MIHIKHKKGDILQSDITTEAQIKMLGNEYKFNNEDDSANGKSEEVRNELKNLKLGQAPV